MFHARCVFLFWLFAEESSSGLTVWSDDLEPICDANRIKAAPKAQLASASTTLRPPDRPLFSDRLSIKNLPVLLRGEKRAIFIPRFHHELQEKTIFSERKCCLSVGTFVFSWQPFYVNKINAVQH
jgi:hypothetical protein